jgi:hypothetical protein
MVAGKPEPPNSYQPREQCRRSQCHGRLQQHRARAQRAQPLGRRFVRPLNQHGGAEDQQTTGEEGEHDKGDRPSDRLTG